MTDDLRTEIEKWAAASDHMWPEEDWDLFALAALPPARLVDLAVDPLCTQGEFFRECLELLLADARRTRDDRVLGQLAEAVVRAETAPRLPDADWLTRAGALLAESRSSAG